MKFLNKLLGKDEERPTWEITPSADRPARKQATALDEPPPAVTAQDGKNPFLDDDSLGNMQLEADASPEDNPYQTHSWQDDPENDTRKMKAIQIDKKSTGPSGDSYNPYDTGSMTRGWKK